MQPGATPAIDAATLAALPAAKLSALVDRIEPIEAALLFHDWRFWARPSQWPPAGDWRVWLLIAGRGFGKTRTGAEFVRGEIEAGRARRVALIGATAADVRDVMVEGESGVMAVCPPWFRPRFEPSKRRLTWPNGAMATTYSADEPDRLRGPQHDLIWADEFAAWRYPETWDMAMLGLRLGAAPRALVTTTPRAVKALRALMARAVGANPRDGVPEGRAAADVVLTGGATYDNKANLPRAFLDEIVSRYHGTRLGRQEIEAELLEDLPGALWQRAQIDNARATLAPELTRIVVAIDPAASSGEGADETGLIVAGLGKDGHGYVLEDLSRRDSPDGWARAAIGAYRRWRADRIVAEVNQGGQMVDHVLRTVDPEAPIRMVHASRAKVARAEPVAALYEQMRVHHVGAFPALEDQMCTFTLDFDRAQAGFSPDRVDALVWALSELMLNRRATAPKLWRA